MPMESASVEERAAILRVKSEEEAGLATTRMTIVSLTKTSIGTGVLAIPQAFAKGGAGLMGVTLLWLAIWNEFSCLRLVDCERLLSSAERERYRKSRESPLAALARVAVGAYGAALVEAVFFALVFGVVTSYLKACHDTASPVVSRFLPGLGSDDSFVFAAMSLPLSMVPDIGRLGPVNSIALLCLAVCFTLVIWYAQQQQASQQPLAWWGPTRSTGSSEEEALSEENEESYYLEAWASGFGVLSFCFGVVPIVPQFVASMQRRDEFPLAVRCSVSLTFAVYVFLGVVVAWLDPSVPGNVLYELPPTGVALAARVAVGLVCIVSAALPVVAGSEILVKRVGHSSPRAKSIAAVAVRVGLYGAGALVAARVPSFATVVAVVGAAAVSFLSFVLPPALHLLIGRSCNKSQHALLSQDPPSRAVLAVDLAALCLGTLVVVFVTAFVADAVIHPPDHEHPATLPPHHNRYRHHHLFSSSVSH